MYNIAVIGGEDSVFGFRALGLSVYPAQSAGEAKSLIRTLAKEGAAIIYITESLARDVEETIEEYKDSALPAIIPIPDNQGSIGYGMGEITKSVQRAVGADILADS